MSEAENGAEPDRDDDASTDAGGEAKRPIYKRPVFIVGALLVLGVIGIVGTLYYLHARKYVSSDDAFVDAHILHLNPQTSGQLVYVADVDNDHVKAGQLLARIRPTGPQAQSDEAQANVEQEQAGVSQALAQLQAAQAQASKARAEAIASAANARKQAADLARYQQLARIDDAAVAGQQLDQARAQAISSAAEAAADRRAVDDQNAQILVARRAVESARARVKAAKARKSQIDVSVGDLTINAPIAGQVVNRSVNVGSYVTPSSEMMAIVPDHIWVTANFKETQITNMRPGDPVDIQIDAFPNVHFHGHVDSFQRGAGQAFALLPPQNATGNFVKVVQRVPVRIEFDRKDNGANWHKYPLGPGMSVVPSVKVR